MKNSAYKKSIIREISSSKARFVSILIIILLGVAFYSGIKATSPNMESSIENFYEKQNLMDSKIVSSLGLNDRDLDLLKNSDKVLDYYGSHTIDANLTNVNSVVRFMEYDSEKSNPINDLVVVEGRLPENSGEIALDEQAFRENNKLKIGGTYTIKGDEDTIKSFKTTSFKIVGMVKSPMYIEKLGKGTTTVGKGTIDYFAVINKEDISMDVYTEIYVRFKNVENVDAYSDEYKEKMEKNNKYLEDLYSNRIIDRITEVKSEAKEEIDKGYEEIENGEQELINAQNKINDGKTQLQEGKEQYEKALKDYNKSIEDGEAQIVINANKLNDGLKELEKQSEVLENAKEQLDNAKLELDKAEQGLINQGVDPNQSIEELNNTIKNLNSLVTSYDNLSNDIKNTVNSIGEGNNIPSDKIQAWKNNILRLGLKDFESLIKNLEENPSQTNIAISIANGVDNVSKNVKANISNLETLVAGLSKYQSGKLEYNKQLQTINNAQSQIKDAKDKLLAGKTQLSKAKEELEKGKIEGKKELEKAKKALDDSEIELLNGEKEVEENKLKLTDAKLELKDAEEQLNKIDNSKYYVFDRNDNPGYSEFNDVVKRISAIATVFPMFFFIVAILICLTTMARMVEENRIEIGTLKALGYNNIEIAKKYIVYASLASIIGSILGVLIGYNLFPSVIYNAYSTQYTLPSLEVVYYPAYIIQGIVISIVCTVGAAMVVLKVDLNSHPSTLMRPKAPKVGKKILLERITPLWKRLNFNQKVTCRNLFRYRQRMIMTVFGIAACAAMIVTGFGLQDSINDLTDKQFNKLWSYQAIVTFEDESSEKDNEEYNKLLNELPEYNSSLNIHQEIVSFSKESMNKQNVTLFVPEDNKSLAKFVLLNDRVSSEKYELTDDGVIINEKLAKLLGASVGDEITMTDENNNSYTVKIDNIIESYLSHSLYISPKYYEEVIGEKPNYNSQLLRLDADTEDENEIAAKLMESNKVINVTLSSYLASTSQDTMETLNIVVVILIVSAGGLALVVLYNLNNINVSERIRELSTIKVLGFYDNEVTMYILRENSILTALGIFVGMFMGKVLHMFVLNTAESDNMMMSPYIYPRSFIYSIMLTLLFSIIVMVMMHRKLKKVNMIDALKSNE